MNKMKNTSFKQQIYRLLIPFFLILAVMTGHRSKAAVSAESSVFSDPAFLCRWKISAMLIR